VELIPWNTIQRSVATARSRSRQWHLTHIQSTSTFLQEVGPRAGPGISQLFAHPVPAARAELAPSPLFG
jgi:hypothetical protein